MTLRLLVLTGPPGSRLSACFAILTASRSSATRTL